MNELIGIDDPQIREALYIESGVNQISGVTRTVLTEPGVIFSNYIRNPGDSDDSADVLPMIQGLEALSCVISGKGKNRLFVVARNRVKENLPNGHEVVKPAIIAAEKKDGRYTILDNGIERMISHLADNGIIWIAPGATTDKDGFTLDLNAGGIRFAKKAKGHLYVAAMITEDSPNRRIVREIQIVEIDIPDLTQVNDPQNQLLHEAHGLIARYAMAVAASLIPSSQQRGDFVEYERIMQQSCDKLREMQSQGLLTLGGFLETG